MTDLFSLRDSDIGRPLTEISGPLQYSDLTADVASVLANQEIIERELKLSNTETSLLMRVRPYRTQERTIDGVVMAFVDVTSRKRLCTATLKQPTYRADAPRSSWRPTCS